MISDETRKKISTGTKIGMALSGATEKIRKSRIGKKHSQETRDKIAKSCKGSNGNNWKGGITPLVRIIRECFKYRQWRSDVFTRDNYTCQECGTKGCFIEAHHIKRFSDIFKEYNIQSLDEALNCEEFWNINNGQTLCRNCHDKTKKL